MKHRTFFWFILPSLLFMVLFIALPIVSVIVQSQFVQHDQVMVEVENCGPFKCETIIQADPDATAALRESAPLGKYNALKTYTNRNHLAIDELKEIWLNAETIFSFIGGVYNLPFYKALFFTLTYTFLVAPSVLVLGLFFLVVSLFARGLAPLRSLQHTSEKLKNTCNQTYPKWDRFGMDFGENFSSFWDFWEPLGPTWELER